MTLRRATHTETGDGLLAGLDGPPCSAYLPGVFSTTPDQGTILLYTLSTLAQTCAALAAFVGAIGLYHLQSLRARRESLLRDIAATLGHPAMTTDQLLAGARTRAKDHHPPLTALLHDYDNAPSWIRRSAKALGAFEAWNLLVIGTALVGFNYVEWLTAWKGTFWALWVVALGTVGVTGWCVYAWTRE